MEPQSEETRVIPHLGLVVYRKPRSCNKWHLPVCSASKRGLLESLCPNNSTMWEEVDFDGCPTMCYILRGRELKAWSALKFTSVWKMFADRLGEGPAKEFFHDLWVRDNNIRAKNRNTWEEHHGGVREKRFNRGPSIRASASFSIV